MVLKSVSGQVRIERGDLRNAAGGEKLVERQRGKVEPLVVEAHLYGKVVKSTGLNTDIEVDYIVLNGGVSGDTVLQTDLVTGLVSGVTARGSGLHINKAISFIRSIPIPIAK